MIPRPVVSACEEVSGEVVDGSSVCAIFWRRRVANAHSARTRSTPPALAAHHLRYPSHTGTRGTPPAPAVPLRQNRPQTAESPIGQRAIARFSGDFGWGSRPSRVWEGEQTQSRLRGGAGLVAVAREHPLQGILLLRHRDKHQFISGFERVIGSGVDHPRAPQDGCQRGVRRPRQITHAIAHDR